MAYQCYFQSDWEDPTTQCKNTQDDCWCSSEHEKAWKEKNYGYVKGQRKLTLKEMQQRLKEMKSSL